MLGNQDLNSLLGQTVYTNDGQKIGELRQVYVDDTTGRLRFITVDTGLFGTRESFVPADAAEGSGDGVTVPFDKDTVKNAPKIDADGRLSPAEEQELFTYYGHAHSERPTTEGAMTRSEEQLRVRTEQHEAGRVRLRKWVDTEQENVTVPVSRERAVLEREPITDVSVDHALSGKKISEEEHEVVLHEERPVVDKTVTPVEQVRVDKETVTEHQAVSEELRTEHIEVDGDADNVR